MSRECESMFEGCTALQRAPELPAKILTNKCYARMFYGCSSLNYIKCLATDISAPGCTKDWVKGVAPSGIFICADGMREAWTPSSATDYDHAPWGWQIVEVSEL